MEAIFAWFLSGAFGMFVQLSYVSCEPVFGYASLWKNAANLAHAPLSMAVLYSIQRSSESLNPYAYYQFTYYDRPIFLRTRYILQPSLTMHSNPQISRKLQEKVKVCSCFSTLTLPDVYHLFAETTEVAQATERMTSKDGCQEEPRAWYEPVKPYQ